MPKKKADKAAAKTTTTTATEAARVTAAGEESLAGRGVKRDTPPDIKDFTGSYVETATGETFGHKSVPDDPKGHTHHLKNDVHFHAVNDDDFKKLFEKK